MAFTPERGTRERILEAAEASLGQCGYHGTRLQQIAERVGIQKASLFHYFPSKEHLYHAVVDEWFDEAEQTIRQVLEADGSPLQKVRRLIETYVDLVATHPDLTKILLRQSLGDAPDGYQPKPDSQRLLAAIVALITDGQQTRAFAAIDAVALVLGVMGMVTFFFTSATVLAPPWCGDTRGASHVERVKRHVIQVVERCLAPERGDLNWAVA